MEMTWVCPPPRGELELILAALWFFPIGAIVMRRHLVRATGVSMLGKVMLFGMAWLTGPFAFFATLGIVLAAAEETFGTLKSLLQIVW